MQIQSSSLAVEEFSKPPLSQILCYPEGEAKDLSLRIEELKALGVKKLILEGRTEISGLHILGKGCVSLVVSAQTDEGKFALKIRRKDANRPSMGREAELLELANKVGVGPKLIRCSDNFLLMELAQGSRVNDWIRGLKGKGMMKRLRSVLRELLDQCYRLDKIGLDHGELSNLSKHVMVDEKVTIIDFETASLNRKVSNLTSVAQYLFIGTPLSKHIRRLLRMPSIQETIEALRSYKKTPNNTTYQALLNKLKLTSLN